jgi:hypothetical protein
MRRLTMCVVVVLGVLCAVDARAQGDRQSPAPVADTGSRDFWFGPPRGSVGFRGNWLFARADSDWYSFVTDQLTLDRKDFNAPGFAVDVGFALGRRADAVIGVDFSRASHVSEYRHFVDNNRLPISQTTQLRTVGLTGSVKYMLTGRGLEVSRLAYVPRQVIPYVGGGGGVLHYDLNQFGDFVDFVDSSVFGSSFKSAGWAPLAQGFAGVDFRVLKRLYLTLDGRYQWARASLGSTWLDFDPIDLAGFKLAAGISFVY